MHGGDAPDNPLARLQLSYQPVAIAFLEKPPPGLNRVSYSAAASCAFWKQAAEGQGFFTTGDDHQNCPVGALTHGAELTPAKGEELQQLVGTMVQLKYLQPHEVPAIPRRTTSLRVAAYAPLADASFIPDVVIFRGDVRQIMLLAEAA